jgi:predicted lipoprotein with Yx(FWY)xxD motif
VTRDARRTLSGPRLAVPAAITVGIVGFLILSAVARSPTNERGGSAAAHSAPAVKLRNNRLGRVLVDAHDRTLYLFLEDAGGKSSCYGPCTRVWPPALVADGAPTAGPGLIARKLTTVARRSSKLRQLVYNGHPLYTTDADAKPGDTNGQGVFNTWFAVSRTGKQVGKADPDAGGY